VTTLPQVSGKNEQKAHRVEGMQNELSTLVDCDVDEHPQGRAKALVEKAEELWKACADALRSQVSEATWKTWFEGIKPIRTTEDRIDLAVPSSLVKDRLEGRYLGLVRDVVGDTLGRPMDIHLEVQSTTPEALFLDFDAAEDDVTLSSTLKSAAANAEGSTSTITTPEIEVLPDRPKASSGSTGGAPLNEDYTFENFVIGASNRFAHAAAQSVAESPAKSYNPLFIHGDAGLGKTHLLHAVGNYVRQNFPNRHVRYVSTETFLNEFVDAIRNNGTTAFKRRYRECDVLMIDDVQFMEHKEGLQEEFFHTFNHLYGANKQIIISSDRHAKALTTLEDRLRSRFLSGLITDVQPPDLETRIAILRKKSEGLRSKVPDDVLEFIAFHVTDNIRELEGALIRVSAFASLNNQMMTMSVAQEILSDLVTGSDKPKTITPKDILDATAETFGFTVEELCGTSRRRPLVTARQIGMYVFREVTDFSYPAIAREFGGRDHTTVIHAVDKITALMFERGQIYNQVTELVHKIKAGN
jgi:chromosomal replication initiator protein